VLYRGQKEALDEFLPLDSQSWITRGNALQLDWLSICPPTGITAKHHADDLFEIPLDQAQIDFENEGGETYICGNPPFSGTKNQSEAQKQDIDNIFSCYEGSWKNVDYVGAWFVKAAEFNKSCDAKFAFVATNSFCQGQQIPLIWELLISRGFKIRFAHTSFKWTNLASNKAGVTVIIAGLDKTSGGQRYLYDGDEKRVVEHISPYLTPQNVKIVTASSVPISHKIIMQLGVYYSKSGGLILSPEEAEHLNSIGIPSKFIRKFLGSEEFIKGANRYCLWISNDELKEALSFDAIKKRIDSVREDRTLTKDKAVNRLALKSHQFREYKGAEDLKILVPIISSESREYFPAGIADKTVIPTNQVFYIPDAPIFALSLIVSKLHLAWIGTVCGRLEMRYRYSNTLGWNTFPIPLLTEKNKADLTKCAEDILLVRESHFPASLADLYNPEKTPENLRDAHDRNDEALERIYIGRRFKNDTERLEKLFELYTKMTSKK
jgi:hypothetical protein